MGQLEGIGVSANTLCPGLTHTNLAHHMPWYVRLYTAVRFAFSQPQTPEWDADLTDVTGFRGFPVIQRLSSPTLKCW